MAKKFLVLHWHPEPKSFCAALYNGAVESLIAAGHEVRTSNLFEMKFNPVSDQSNFKAIKNPEYYKQQAEETNAIETEGFADDVKLEQEKLAWCDVLIIVFPLWWFSVPAMIKGWFDRVLAMGVSYGGGKFYQDGVYKGKKAVLTFTTGGPEATYVPGGWTGDINGVLRPIHRGVLEFCGFSVLKPNISFSAAHPEDSVRKEWLAAWQARVVGLADEEAIEVGQY